MAIIQRQTTVSAAPDEVFTYLSDISKHPEWAAHKLEIEPTTPGPIQVGSTFRCVGHQMGTHKGEVKITELVPGQKITFESEDDIGRFRHGFVIEREGEATRVTKIMEPLQINSLPFKLLSPVMSSVVAPRGLDGDLKRIKGKLEHTAWNAHDRD